jgi:hypothetical protein
MGTLLALLVYFWRDWLKLIPAGLADDPRPLVQGRPRSQDGLAARRRHDPGRAVGPLFDTKLEELVREPAESR